MSLIKCPECKKEVSSKAKACPHCGVDLKSKGGGFGCLSFIGIIILIFFISVIYDAINNDEPEKEETYTYTNELAYNYAKDFVKEKLKSPSTAEFPGVFDRKGHVTPLSSNKYYVDSWVDSQNSFGAVTRAMFSCTIRFEGASVYCDNLRLVE